MNGHRRAAIALHGLQPQDRASILAELPDADQAVLRSHLNELHELGFDPVALSAGIPPPKSASPAQATRSPDPLVEVRQASPETMYRLLEHEPAALVADVLNMETWTWAPQLMEMMAPPRRQKVRTAVEAVEADAPMRKRMLSEALVAGIEASGMPAKPAPAGRVRGWMARIRAWKR